MLAAQHDFCVRKSQLCALAVAAVDANVVAMVQGCRNGGGEGRGAPAFLTRGTRGAVLPLAFYRESNKVKRLLCSSLIAKVSAVSVSLPLSEVISASVGFDSSY